MRPDLRRISIEPQAADRFPFASNSHLLRWCWNVLDRHLADLPLAIAAVPAYDCGSPSFARHLPVT